MTKPADVTCDDCYFRQNQLCALNVAPVCPTFRPADGGRRQAPGRPFVFRLDRTPDAPHFALPIASTGSSRPDQQGESDPSSDPPLSPQGREPGRCDAFLQRACFALPADARTDVLDEWLDEIECARESGRPVIGRTVSLLFFALPALSLRLRWRRLIRQPGR